MTGDNKLPRTVVFGFDALDFKYLDRFADELPHFERLRSDGIDVPLRSTIPPWTGSAWPSMYTGMDPSHHGVYGFFDYDGYPDQGNVVSRNDVDAPALWNYLTSDEIESVVMNVPVTHPAEPVDGALIPGYLANEDDPGYPDDVRADLDASMDEPYRIYSRGELSDEPEEKLAGYLELIENRRQAAETLVSDRDWRLAVIQVQKTDAVFHNFDDEDAFRGVYRAADDLLGTVLDAVPAPVNVVVCSDHGIGPVDGYQIHINEVLRREGYVETTDENDELTLAGQKQGLIGDGTTDATSEGVTDRVLRRVAGAAARAGVSPDQVYGAAKAVGLEDTLLSIAPDSVTDAVSESVDWRASMAYCRSGTRLGVRINLEGRDPDGIVPPGEYDRVQSDLVELLSGLTTPDGKPAFDLVVPREEVYDGPHIDNGPDVVTVPRNMNNGISTALYGTPFLPVEKYDHKRSGVFLGAGPGFDSGFDGDELDLTDVAPIVMALLERPVPTQMTGTVPQKLVSGPVEYDEYTDVSYGTEQPDESRGDGQVTERLEDLGYL